MTRPDLRPPRPTVTPTAAPFWAALRQHRVELQRCLGCGSWVHYPRVRCPHCGGERLGFEAVADTGTVYTMTIARQPTAPHFAAEVPQVIAVVELDCGVRLSTTLVTAEPEQVRLGDRVEAVYDDGADGITLLRFRPVAPR